MRVKNREVIKAENEALVIDKLSKIIEKCSKEAITQRNIFTLAVSGGSVVNMLVKGLPDIETDWSKWKILFCDERIVPEDDKESTFGLYKEKLIPNTSLQQHQFIAMDFSFANNPANGAVEAALDYEKKLREIFPPSSITQLNGHDYPVIDCAILGMGPDGHTCSLFPDDSRTLSASSWVVSITDSPKPPPCRITLTLPVLNSCRQAVFPIVGASKADMVQSIIEDDVSLPANMIRPINGTVSWILDHPAASKLSSSL